MAFKILPVLDIVPGETPGMLTRKIGEHLTPQNFDRLVRWHAASMVALMVNPQVAKKKILESVRRQCIEIWDMPHELAYGWHDDDCAIDGIDAAMTPHGELTVNTYGKTTDWIIDNLKK